MHGHAYKLTQKNKPTCQQEVIKKIKNNKKIKLHLLKRRLNDVNRR